MRFNEASDLFDDPEFPATRDEIVDEIGDRELEYPNGSETETIEEIFDRSGTETFDTAEEARLTYYAALDGDAVGRKGYSDRDPPTPGTDDENDPVSF